MKLRPSPASALALIALLAALGGSAYAAGAFTAKQKKEVAKIAQGVFDKSAAEASVDYVANATSAARATSAERAKRAEQAGRAEVAERALEVPLAARATEATKADHATEAEQATEAQSAQSALQADRAGVADSAAEVPMAAEAGDTDTVGGVGQGLLQRAIDGCPPPKVISDISATGRATCSAPSVRIIRATVARGNSRTSADTRSFGFNGGQVTVACRDPEDPLGNGESPTLQWAGNGELHFFYFRDGSKVVGSETLHTSGDPVHAHSDSFDSRLEGQFIWTKPEAITTLSIHVVAGRPFCEVGATVVTAAG